MQRRNRAAEVCGAAGITREPAFSLRIDDERAHDVAETSRLGESGVIAEAQIVPEKEERLR